MAASAVEVNATDTAKLNLGENTMTVLLAILIQQGNLTKIM